MHAKQSFPLVAPCLLNIGRLHRCIMFTVQLLISNWVTVMVVYLGCVHKTTVHQYTHYTCTLSCPFLHDSFIEFSKWSLYFGLKFKDSLCSANIKSKDSFETLRTSRFQNWLYFLNLVKIWWRYCQKTNCQVFFCRHSVICI